MSINEHIVVTVKLKSGEDIIGLYAGETDESGSDKSLVLYRPIKIRQVSYNVYGKTVFSYASDFYSLFGTSLVTVPYSNVLCKSVVPEFFKIYYAKALQDLLPIDSKIQESYLAYYAKEELKELLADTDSIFVDTHSDYVQ